MTSQKIASEETFEKVIQYIDRYWNSIILRPTKQRLGSSIIQAVRFRFQSRDHDLIAVPYACIVPNTGKYEYIFYWDSYFIFQGIKRTKHQWIIPSMVQNFLYLFGKYHIIPNLTHPEALGRSQPPLLTSMIFDAYDIIQSKTILSARIRNLLKSPQRWLTKAMTVAKKEYEDVWQSDIVPDHHHYNHRVAEYNLNRYGGRDIGYPQDAEQESGWDMTSRFYNRCNEFLAVDLNCFLYKYETDFAKSAKILKKPHEEKLWTEIAEGRKNRMMDVFWNEEKGFFFDFDYVHKKQSEFYSLAGFIPLWAGLATAKQAQKIVANVPRFETDYGLTITDKTSLPETFDFSSIPEPFRITIQESLIPKQWDYPNIWPPLEYLTILGLIHYGFTTDAKRIMQKSIAASCQAFEKYNAMLEKMDGVTGDMPKTYWYPTQLGFGWTNAVFSEYTRLLAQI